MMLNVKPVQPASSKKGNTRQQYSGRQGGSEGFASMLAQYTSQYTTQQRQDGFSHGSSPPSAAVKNKEIEILRHRIEHVNRTLLSGLGLQGL